MNRSWPVHACVVFCAFFAPAHAPCQSGTPPLDATAAAEARKLPAADPAEADIPQGILNLIRDSQVKYQEGSNLIKSGESAKARAAFNKAVDLLLQSDYDLVSTPVLNRYFQDIIHRIQQDESRYLRPLEESQDKPEKAVVDELNELDLIPINVDPALQDEVAADLASTKYDIPITLNDKVLKSLNFWLGKGRKYFTDGLIRSGRYRDMIEGIFREESIPLDIMYLAQVESLFKTNALSRARAMGIWQFGKGTAIRYGLRVDRYIDERSDPEKSTRAAARYLSDLFAMFRDWNLVLAAYNWGEGKVLQLIKRSGLNDFWEMTELRRRNFPRETKNHVPLIMASIILAHNPEKYGLPRKLEPPLTCEKLAVAKPIDLRAVARILNVTLEEVKQLNPSLRGLSTPANYPGFQLKVPPGSIQAESSEKIAQLPEVKFRPPADTAGRYRVQSGDTFYSIAARHRVTVAALQRANAGVSPKSLRTGSWIRIPEPSAARTGPRILSTRLSSPKIRTSLTPAGKRDSKGTSASPDDPAAGAATAPASKKPSVKEIATR